MNGIEAFFEEIRRVVLPVYEQVVKTVDMAAMEMAMSLRAQRESAEDYQIRKWLSQVPHGGIVGDKAVLIVYNEQHPSQSYLIVEDINS